MSCKKKCYQTREEALKMKGVINTQKGYDLKNVYYCNKCKAYHHTSWSKKKKKKRDQGGQNGWKGEVVAKIMKEEYYRKLFGFGDY